MSVTAALLKVFRVDQQLRGLKSRLHAAERFLAEQEKLLKGVEDKHSQLSAQLKQLKVSISGEEGEAASIDARMAKLREAMNSAKTNKEYSAFLAELDALKKKKKEIEDAELAQMGQVESLQKQILEQAKARDERKAIITKARADRDERAAEIKGRVDELSTQRDELVKSVPAEALRVLDEMSAKKGDEAMSPVEVIDRRAHEWSCGSCMMTLTVETVNSLSVGRLTRCHSCKVVLFSEEDLVSQKAAATKPAKPKAAAKPKAPRKGSAAAATAAAPASADAGE
jgi:hypothetical protein